MEERRDIYAPLPPRKPYDSPYRPPILEGVEEDEFKPFIKKYERPVPHMYLDSKGNVTAGVGLHLPSVKEAIKNPFDYGDLRERRATEKEIYEAYQKVKSAPKGNFSADYFDPRKENGFDKIYLQDDVMERMFDERLRVHARELKQKFPNFNDIEGAAQKALLDMHYNIGNTYFTDYYNDPVEGRIPKWPKLFDAINRRDWAMAAQESNRKDVQDERNAKIREWFLEADQAKKRR